MTKICVTGASGFLAKHLVYQLLEKGFEVTGTVRSLKAEKKISYLKHLQSKFPNKLTLFEADLQIPHSFDGAIEGCDGVMHTASPYWMHGPMSEEEALKTFINPAVEGTLNVLNSCKKFQIKRVVMTSSVAAVVIPSAPQASIIDEQYWNTGTSYQEVNGAYRISKTKAEQEAWKFSEENKEWGFELVTLLPPGILGPWYPEPVADLPDSIKNGENREEAAQSMNFMIAVLTGKMQKLPPVTLGLIDVRDLAKAHILAWEKKNANGRYIISAETSTYLEVAQYVKAKFPELPVVTESDYPNFKASYVLSSEKSKKDLGMEYRSGFEAVVEGCKSLIDLGAVPKH